MHLSSPHACYMPCPSHPPSFDLPNYILKKVLIMQFVLLIDSFLFGTSIFSKTHTHIYIYIYKTTFRENTCIFKEEVHILRY
jgi:hypothetical protein